MSEHIFISYSRVDQAKVRKLYHDLIQAGVNCWLDVECISSGADWDKELQQAIETCTHFIIVCTPASMTSQNVKAEWQYSFQLNKVMHPVILEPCSVPFRLQIYQHIDVVELGYENALAELIAVLPAGTQPKTETANETTVTNETDALLKRAVANWQSFGLLLDRATFSVIDQQRDQLNFDDSALVLMLLSARRSGDSLDFWADQLKLNPTALGIIEDTLIDEIDDQYSFVRRAEFELLASNSLIAKITQLIKLTNDEQKLEILLDSVEPILLQHEQMELDVTELEGVLLDYFEQNPGQVVARALGWINSSGLLQQALDILDNKGWDEIQDASLKPYLAGLIYMTVPEATAYLQTLTPVDFGYVPAGPFIMGDNSIEKSVQHIIHEVFVPGFWLAHTPVTEREYAAYRNQTGGGTTHHARSDYPVIAVNWLDAKAYTAWLSEARHLPIDLPTEAMWEKAASWHPIEQRKLHFPWGDEADPSRCNTIEGKYTGILPIGSFSPQGDSPYGIQDMVGNVWEWTSSIWMLYPYHARDGREIQSATTEMRVMRGVSHDARRGFAKGVVTRAAFDEGYKFNESGFRVAIVIAR